MRVLRGKSLSPGYASGKAFIYSGTFSLYHYGDGHHINVTVDGAMNQATKPTGSGSNS